MINKNLSETATHKNELLIDGIEPATNGLLDQRSNYWAKPALLVP